MEKLDKNKLILPVAIVLGCVVLGGSFYAIQVNKEESTEKQQQIELQAKTEQDKVKAEQDNKEYIAKRKNECYSIFERERKQYNNVDSSFYREKGTGFLESDDVCVVVYTTNKYKGVDCDAKYKDMPGLLLDCITGTFNKEF